MDGALNGQDRIGTSPTPLIQHVYSTVRFPPPQGWLQALARSTKRETSCLDCDGAMLLMFFGQKMRHLPTGISNRQKATTYNQQSTTNDQ
jgi:hypothetical protein